MSRTNLRALSLSSLVERLELAVEGEGWLISHHPYDDFPPAKDSADVADKSFAVGAISTEFLIDDRQRGNLGMHAETIVGVRYLVDIAALSKRTSYRRALDAEVELVSRLLRAPTLPDLLLRVDDSSRGFASETSYLGEVRITVRHFYPTTME